MPLQKTGAPHIKDSCIVCPKFLDTSIRPAATDTHLSVSSPEGREHTDAGTASRPQPAITMPGSTVACSTTTSSPPLNSTKTLLVAVVFPCLWALRIRSVATVRDQKIDILQFQQDDLGDSPRTCATALVLRPDEEVRQSAGRKEQCLILQHKVGNYQNRQEDLGSFAQKIQTMPMNAIFSLFRWTGGSDESSAMGKVSRRLLVGAFFRSSISARTVLLYLFSLISLSRHLMHFCRLVSARNFVFSDSYSSNVDAMVLSACRMLGIRTIGYQYSFRSGHRLP